MDRSPYRVRLLVLMGPPAAGKSTYAAALEGYTVVSPDAIRELAGIPPGEGHLATFSAAYRITEKTLARGKNVVFDSTALTENVRRNLRKIAHKRGVEAHLVVVHAEPRTCLGRNRKRLEPVPEDRMRSMLTDYQRQYPLTALERWASVRIIDGTRKLVAV